MSSGMYVVIVDGPVWLLAACAGGGGVGGGCGEGCGDSGEVVAYSSWPMKPDAMAKRGDVDGVLKSAKGIKVRCSCSSSRWMRKRKLRDVAVFIHPFTLDSFLIHRDASARM